MLVRSSVSEKFSVHGAALTKHMVIILMTCVPFLWIKISFHGDFHSSSELFSLRPADTNQTERVAVLGAFTGLFFAALIVFIFPFIRKKRWLHVFRLHMILLKCFHQRNYLMWCMYCSSVVCMSFRQNTDDQRRYQGYFIGQNQLKAVILGMKTDRRMLKAEFEVNYSPSFQLVLMAILFTWM